MERVSNRQDKSEMRIILSDDNSDEDSDNDEDKVNSDNSSHIKSKFLDKSVFIVSFVPIILLSGSAVVWKNETPLVYTCRTVKFKFLTKSTEQVKVRS